MYIIRRHVVGGAEPRLSLDRPAKPGDGNIIRHSALDQDPKMTEPQHSILRYGRMCLIRRALSGAICLQPGQGR